MAEKSKPSGLPEEPSGGSPAPRNPHALFEAFLRGLSPLSPLDTRLYKVKHLLVNLKKYSYTHARLSAVWTEVESLLQEQEDSTRQHAWRVMDVMSEWYKMRLKLLRWDFLRVIAKHEGDVGAKYQSLRKLIMDGRFIDPFGPEVAALFRTWLTEGSEPVPLLQMLHSVLKRAIYTFDQVQITEFIQLTAQVMQHAPPSNVQIQTEVLNVLDIINRYSSCPPKAIPLAVETLANLSNAFPARSWEICRVLVCGAAGESCLQGLFDILHNSGNYRVACVRGACYLVTMVCWGQGSLTQFQQFRWQALRAFSSSVRGAPHVPVVHEVVLSLARLVRKHGASLVTEWDLVFDILEAITPVALSAIGLLSHEGSEQEGAEKRAFHPVFKRSGPSQMKPPPSRVSKLMKQRWPLEKEANVLMEHILHLALNPEYGVDLTKSCEIGLKLLPLLIPINRVRLVRGFATKDFPGSKPWKNSMKVVAEDLFTHDPSVIVRMESLACLMTSWASCRHTPAEEYLLARVLCPLFESMVSWPTPELIHAGTEALAYLTIEVTSEAGDTLLRILCDLPVQSWGRNLPSLITLAPSNANAPSLSSSSQTAAQLGPVYAVTALGGVLTCTHLFGPPKRPQLLFEALCAAATQGATLPARATALSILSPFRTSYCGRIMLDPLPQLPICAAFSWDNIPLSSLADEVLSLPSTSETKSTASKDAPSPAHSGGRAEFDSLFVRTGARGGPLGPLHVRDRRHTEALEELRIHKGVQREPSEPVLGRGGFGFVRRGSPIVVRGEVTADLRLEALYDNAERHRKPSDASSVDSETQGKPPGDLLSSPCSPVLSIFDRIRPRSTFLDSPGKPSNASPSVVAKFSACIYELLRYEKHPAIWMSTCRLAQVLLCDQGISTFASHHECSPIGSDRGTPLGWSLFGILCEGRKILPDRRRAEDSPRSSTTSTEPSEDIVMDDVFLANLRTFIQSCNAHARQLVGYPLSSADCALKWDVKSPSASASAASPHATDASSVANTRTSSPMRIPRAHTHTPGARPSVFTTTKSRSSTAPSEHSHASQAEGHSVTPHTKQASGPEASYHRSPLRHARVGPDSRRASIALDHSKKEPHSGRRRHTVGPVVSPVPLPVNEVPRRKISGERSKSPALAQGRESPLPPPDSPSGSNPKDDTKQPWRPPGLPAPGSPGVSAVDTLEAWSSRRKNPEAVEEHDSTDLMPVAVPRRLNTSHSTPVAASGPPVLSLPQAKLSPSNRSYRSSRNSTGSFDGFDDSPLPTRPQLSHLRRRTISLGTSASLHSSEQPEADTSHRSTRRWSVPSLIPSAFETASRSSPASGPEQGGGIALAVPGSGSPRPAFVNQLPGPQSPTSYSGRPPPIRAPTTLSPARSPSRRSYRRSRCSSIGGFQAGWDNVAPIFHVDMCDVWEPKVSISCLFSDAVHYLDPHQSSELDLSGELYRGLHGEERGKKDRSAQVQASEMAFSGSDTDDSDTVARYPGKLEKSSDSRTFLQDLHPHGSKLVSETLLLSQILYDVGLNPSTAPLTTRYLRRLWSDALLALLAATYAASPGLNWMDLLPQDCFPSDISSPKLQTVNVEEDGPCAAMATAISCIRAVSQATSAAVTKAHGSTNGRDFAVQLSLATLPWATMCVRIVCHAVGGFSQPSADSQDTAGDSWEVKSARNALIVLLPNLMELFSTMLTSTAELLSPPTKREDQRQRYSRSDLSSLGAGISLALLPCLRLVALTTDSEGEPRSQGSTSLSSLVSSLSSLEMRIVEEVCGDILCDTPAGMKESPHADFGSLRWALLSKRHGVDLPPALSFRAICGSTRGSQATLLQPVACKDHQAVALAASVTGVLPLALGFLTNFQLTSVEPMLLDACCHPTHTSEADSRKDSEWFLSASSYALAAISMVKAAKLQRAYATPSEVEAPLWPVPYADDLLETVQGLWQEAHADRVIATSHSAATATERASPRQSPRSSPTSPYSASSPVNMPNTQELPSILRTTPPDARGEQFSVVPVSLVGFEAETAPSVNSHPVELEKPTARRSFEVNHAVFSQSLTYPLELVFTQQQRYLMTFPEVAVIDVSPMAGFEDTASTSAEETSSKEVVLVTYRSAAAAWNWRVERCRGMAASDVLHVLPLLRSQPQLCRLGDVSGASGGAWRGNAKQIQMSPSTTLLDMLQHILDIPFLQLSDISTKDFFHRAINVMDRLHPFHTIKAGLLYVKPGQKTEKDILQNGLDSQVSRGFASFLSSLGYILKLSPKSGVYSGGLDTKNHSDGDAALVSFGPNSHILWHTGPLMPTKDINSKKRHVMNDFVVVIYLEDDASFNPAILPSSFGFVYILVRQTPCSICVLAKSSLPWFGCVPFVGQVRFPGHSGDWWMGNATCDLNDLVPFLLRVVQSADTAARAATIGRVGVPRNEAERVSLLTRTARKLL